MGRKLSGEAKNSVDLADIVNAVPLAESVNRMEFVSVVRSLGNKIASVEQVFEKLADYPKTLALAKKSWENVKLARIESEKTKK